MWIRNLPASGGSLAALLGGLPVPGSVLFVGPGLNIAQDNANFFWDDAANRLGLGTNVPGAALDIDQANIASNAEQPILRSQAFTQTITAPVALVRTNQFFAPTFTSVAAQVIAQAATVYINGAPVAAGGVTITAPYALWVDAGIAQFDGAVQCDSFLDVAEIGVPANPAVNRLRLFAVDVAGATQFSILDSAGTQTFFVPTTRVLTAGAYLTGGGDLSADRAFAVVPGLVGDILPLGNTAVAGAVGRVADAGHVHAGALDGFKLGGDYNIGATNAIVFTAFDVVIAGARLSAAAQTYTPAGASIAPSTFYYLYAYNVAGVATITHSTTAPDSSLIFMTGNTAYRYLGWFVTDATAAPNSVVYRLRKLGNEYWWNNTDAAKPASGFSYGATTTSIERPSGPTAIGGVPPHIRHIMVRVGIQNSNDAVLYSFVYMGTAQNTVNWRQLIHVPAAAAQAVFTYCELELTTNRTVWLWANVATGVQAVVDINVLGLKE